MFVSWKLAPRNPATASHRARTKTPARRESHLPTACFFPDQRAADITAPNRLRRRDTIRPAIPAGTRRPAREECLAPKRPPEYPALAASPRLQRRRLIPLGDRQRTARVAARGIAKTSRQALAQSAAAALRSSTDECVPAV